ncbi:MAG: hypothetical protein ABWY00_00945 [Dongiaceae bacterium]
MGDMQRLTVEDLIANAEITVSRDIDPVELAKMKSDFAKYARVVATDTELSLNPDLDEETYQEQLREIVRLAAYFCMLDVAPTAADSPENYLQIVFDGLDTKNGNDTWMQALKGRLRRFIDAANADGQVTFQEVVDFLVLTDTLADEDRVIWPRSYRAAARFCLEQNGIEPTVPRIDALARMADTGAECAKSDEAA